MKGSETHNYISGQSSLRVDTHRMSMDELYLTNLTHYICNSSTATWSYQKIVKITRHERNIFRLKYLWSVNKRKNFNFPVTIERSCGAIYNL